MTSVIPARRRAEEFAAQVDGPNDGRSTRPVRSDDARADLLELVAALRAAPGPTPRPEFVADLRSRLMTEADTALRPVDTRLALPAHTRTRRDRRLAAAAGAIALVGAGSSVAVASQSALPGDALYPIKRAIESAQSAVLLDEEARAGALLDRATARLTEATDLTQRGTAEGYAALPQALDDFSTQAADASELVLADYAEDGDPAAVEELRDFASRSMDTLAELDALVPSSAREALNNAARTLTVIDEQARAACPTCGGDLIEIPPALLAAFPTPAEQREVAPEAVLAPVDDRDDAPGRPEQDDGSGGREGGGGGDDPVLTQPPILGDGGSGGQDDGGDGTKDAPELTDLTDLLISSDGSGSKDRKKSGGGGDGEGLLDPVVDPLLDPLTGEGGLLED